MNELFDKILIRFLLSIIILLGIGFFFFLYKKLYPETNEQTVPFYNPEKNYAKTIHLFGRLFGLGLIFTQFQIVLYGSHWASFFSFIMVLLISFTLFIIGAFIVDSIALGQFVISEEIEKKKNIPFSMITFIHAIGIGYLINIGLGISILKETYSIILLFIYWLFAIASLGLVTKAFQFVGSFKFEHLANKRNMGISLSYFGFFIAMVILLSNSFNHKFESLQRYVLLSILKLLLGLIIMPIFIVGLRRIFALNVPKEHADKWQISLEDPSFGIGLSEGVVFFVAALATSVITGNIHFQNLYFIY